MPVIGIPKTIDNDVAGTDASIGFHTAAQIATDLIDRLYSTAESHNRVMVCEVMGRHAGWIGYTAGVAAGADVILLPEHPFDIDLACRRIREVHALRRPFSIVVVSEGAMPAPGTMTMPEYPLDANGFPRLGRRRQTRGRGDRAAHGLRDARDGARPRAARRVAGRVRSRAGHAARERGGRGGARRALGLADGPARREDRPMPIAEVEGPRPCPRSCGASQRCCARERASPGAPS